MTISFSGLASGLDTSSWVDSLVALKRAKVATLEEQKSDIELTRDAINNIKSFFSSFRTMLEKVTDTKLGVPSMDLFAQNLANSTNVGVVSATATTEAKEATYDIKVDQLASNTQAASAYSTIHTSVTTATLNSKLTDLGVCIAAGGSSIGITVGEVKHWVDLTQSDTLGTLTEKLQDIGVNASFNERSGVFTIGVSVDDIDDHGTNFTEAMKLKKDSDVVEHGYQSGVLLTNKTEYQYFAATGTTKLADIGVTSGRIDIEKNNGTTISFNLDNNKTISEFKQLLIDNEVSAEFEEGTGIFTINNAKILDTSETNIKDVFGLDLDIYERTQTTSSLTQVVAKPVDASTTMSELAEACGITLSDTDSENKFTVTDSNNNTHTITFSENDTLGTVLGNISNQGLSATVLSDGTIMISGGTLSMDTIDPFEMFGLEDSPYTAMSTGQALQYTVVTHNIADLNTKFRQMGITQGILRVTIDDGDENTENDNHYLTITTQETIGDFITQLGNLGLSAHLDPTTGVLEIVGGEFYAPNAGEVTQLYDGGKITEDVGATNLLESLGFGDDGSIAPEMTTVSFTRAMSKSINYSVTQTMNATSATTINQILGSDDGTEYDNPFDNPNAIELELNVTAGHENEIYTITAQSGWTIGDLVDALDALGVNANYDEDANRIYIENAYFTEDYSTDSDLFLNTLGLETVTAGCYKTSTVLHSNTSIVVDATRDSKLSLYSGNSNQLSVTLYDAQGNTVASETTLTGNSSIGDLIDWINSFDGYSAALQNGILTIRGGYITTAAGNLEDGMGLQTSSTSSYAIGEVVTATVIAPATGTAILGEIITGLDTYSCVAGETESVDDDVYTLFLGGQEITGITSSSSLNEIIDKIVAKSGTAILDSSGRMTVEGGALTGTVAEALGFHELNVTVTVGQTQTSTVGVSYTTTELATESDKISDFVDMSGYTDDTRKITISSNGTDVATVSVSNTSTFADFFEQLTPYGINCDLTDGVIRTTAPNGVAARGNLISDLQMEAQSVIVTTTTATTQTSSTAITYTTTQLATESDKISDFVDMTEYTDDTRKVTISSNGTDIATVSVSSTSTFADFFEQLTPYGINCDLTDGVIRTTAPNGVAARGNLISDLQMEAQSVIVTTTTATTQTSSTAITYTTTQLATESDKISDFVDMSGYTDDTRKITISSNGTDVATVSVSNTSTFADFFEQLTPYGINCDLTDGVIRVTAPNGVVARGNLISDLQMEAQSVIVTTTSGTTQTSSAMVTYTTTEYATESDKIKDFVTSFDAALFDRNVTITSNGTDIATLNVSSTSTFAQFFAQLDDYGINCDLTDGVIRITEPNGVYLDGDLINALGMTAQGTTITTTVGVTQSSTVGVTYSTTEYASESDKIDDFTNISVFDADERNVTIVSNGTDIATVNVSTTATFAQFFAQLDDYGINCDLTDGVIRITEPDGVYVTGDLIYDLGMIAQASTITTTVGVTQSSTVGVTYTTTELATESDKIDDFTNISGFDADERNVTIVSNGTDIATVNVSTTATFAQFFAQLDDYGINCDLTDGVIRITEPDGVYVTGDLIHELGMTAQAVVTTTTAGVTQSSSSSVIYTVTSAATGATELGEVLGNYYFALTMSASTTVDDIYYAAGDIAITDAAGLAKLAELSQSYTFGGNKIFVLENDIDLSDYADWTGIGNGNRSFSGIFDGQGHTVSNINITSITSDTRYRGFFSSCIGRIKDLNLDNVNITGTYTDAVVYVGALAGTAFGEISGINVTNLNMDVFVGNNSGVGGLVGSGSNTISSCSTQGTILSSTSGAAFVGGITNGASRKLTIKDCKSDVDIIGVSGDHWIGGINGHVHNSNGNTSEIINCINTGNLSSNVPNRGTIGGILGNLYIGGKINISNCVNLGEISSNAAYKGQIWASHWGDAGQHATITVTNSSGLADENGTPLGYAQNPGDVSVTTSNSSILASMSDISDKFKNSTVFAVGTSSIDLPVTNSLQMAVRYTDGSYQILDFDNDTTLGEICSALTAAGVGASVNADGQIVINNQNGTYVTGQLAERLGISAVAGGTYTIEGGKTISSTEPLFNVQYNTTLYSRTAGFVTSVTSSNTTTNLAGATAISTLANNYHFDDSSKTYTISTTDELLRLQRLMREYVSNSEGTFVLTADLDMSGISWDDSICDNDGDFSGTFDGHGHVIRNLNGSSELFSTIEESGTVKNLGLENVNINSNAETLGSLARSVCNQSKIANCYVTGRVRNNSYGAYVGGLVGEVSNSSGGETTTSIVQCYTNVNVQGDTVTAGGIVGNITQGLCIIDDCVVESTISGIQSGGIFGRSSANVSVSVKSTTVDAQLSGYNAYVIAGNNSARLALSNITARCTDTSGTIINNYATGGNITTAGTNTTNASLNQVHPQLYPSTVATVTTTPTTYTYQVMHDGELYTRSIQCTRTYTDLFTQLAADGIECTLYRNQTSPYASSITINCTADDYIVSMDTALQRALGINFNYGVDGKGYTYSELAKTDYTNSASTAFEFSNVQTLTTSTSLSSLFPETFVQAVNSVDVSAKSSVQLMTATSGVYNGSGGTYKISTTADLSWMSGKRFENATLVLANDIDAQSVAGFQGFSIGNSTTVDGNGYAISNLNITNNSVSAGFVCTASNTNTIKNLGLENVSVTGSAQYMGAILGKGEGATTVQNCYVTGEVNNSQTSIPAVVYTGGIVGNIHRDSGTLSNLNASGVSVTKIYGDIGVIAGHGSLGNSRYYINSAVNGTQNVIGDNAGLQPDGSVLSDPGDLSITLNSETTLSFTTSNTVDDIISALAGYDIAGSVSADGRLTLNPTGDNYIVGISGALADNLNLSATGSDYYDSNHTTTIYQNKTSYVQSTGLTQTLSTSTTLGSLFETFVQAVNSVDVSAKSSVQTMTLSDGVYNGGFGTFKISTTEDLAWMSGKRFQYATIVLANDIDAQSVAGFQGFSIGNTTTIDGNGHAISNLNITNNDVSAGFVCTASSTNTIKNLGLENVSVTGSAQFMGAVLGKAYGNTIVRNCYVTGEVINSQTSIPADVYTGGIVGSCSLSLSYLNASGVSVTNTYGNIGALAGYGSLEELSRHYINSAVNGTQTVLGNNPGVYADGSLVSDAADLSITLNSETTLSFTTSNTVDDIISALAGYDIAGSVSADGRLTLNPTGDNYIVGISGALADNLNLSATGSDYYDSNHTTTTYQNQSSSVQSAELTQTLSTETTMSDLYFPGANEFVNAVNSVDVSAKSSVQTMSYDFTDNYYYGNGQTYKISTTEDLAWMSDKAFKDATIVLANDIDAQSIQNFKGIGILGNVTIDGNGHVIKNLNIHAATLGTGFVSCASDVLGRSNTVKDLGLENVHVEGSSLFSGAIIARTEGTHFVSNCFVTGEIINNSASASSNTGGICGKSIDVSNVNVQGLSITNNAGYKGAIMGTEGGVFSGVNYTNAAVNGTNRFIGTIPEAVANGNVVIDVTNFNQEITLNNGKITVAVDATIGDVLTQLAAFDIQGSISNDGSLTLTPHGSSYITAIDSRLAQALNLSATGSDYYDASHVTSTNQNQSSSVQSAELTQTLTSDTTFAEMGLVNLPQPSEFVNAVDSVDVSAKSGVQTMTLNDDIYDGNGGTFKISTTADLAWMSGKQFQNVTLVLANDINAQSVEGFQGFSMGENTSFDGNGYVISNLNIGSYNDTNTGFILSSDGVDNDDGNNIIRNLGLENVHVEGSSVYFGALLGYSFSTNIDNCYVTGDVVNNAEIASNTGGLVGRGQYSSILNANTQAVTITAGGHKGALIGYGGTISGVNYANSAVNTTDRFKGNSATGADGVTKFDAAPQTITLNNGLIVVSGNETVGDVLTQLAAYDISGNISADGRLTLTPTGSNYITAIGSSLADALGLSVGEGETYVTDTDTIFKNKNSAEQSDNFTYSATTDTTIHDIIKETTGQATSDNQTITINGTTQITVQSTGTIGDMFTQLAAYDIECSLGSDGLMSLISRGNNYVTGVSEDLLSSLHISVGEGNTYTTDTDTVYKNKNSAEQSEDFTHTLSTDTLFSEKGLLNVVQQNEFVNAVDSVDVSAKSSVQTMTHISGTRYDGSGGTFKISTTADLEWMSGKSFRNATIVLANDIDAGSLENYKGFAMLSNTTVDGNGYKISNLNINQISNGYTGFIYRSSGSSAGNRNVVKNLGLENVHVPGNGDSVGTLIGCIEQYTNIDNCYVTGEVINNTNDDTNSTGGLIGSISDDASANVSNINIQGVSITSSAGYIGAVSGFNTDIIGAVYTNSAVNGTNIISGDSAATADGTTTFDTAPQTITLNNGMIVVSGNETVGDVLTQLAAYNIQGSVSADGRLTLTPTGDNYIKSMGTAVANALNINTGENYTYHQDIVGTGINISTILSLQTESPITDATTLAELGITNGFIYMKDKNGNDIGTISIDTATTQTIGDFRNQLEHYGFISDVTPGGRLEISSVSGDTLHTGTNTTGLTATDSNILNILGIDDWQTNGMTQTSDTLTYVSGVKHVEMTDKISSLVEADEKTVAGDIYVYHDGTRSTISIAEDETLQTLSAKLSQYGITMDLSSGETLYFSSDNETYLEQKAGGSQILDIFNANDWEERLDTRSTSLEYDKQETTDVLTRSTKLVGDLGITKGAFYIYENGVRNTASVTEDTTVDDLIQTMNSYGLVTDLSDGGKLSVSGHGNSYLAASELGSGNSNIVSELFERWEFTKAYESNGLDVPQDELTAINRSTKLSEIIKVSSTVLTKTTGTHPLATSTTKISDCMTVTAGDRSITVTTTATDGTVGSTIVTLATTATFENLFTALTPYGITASISDGVITVTSANGTTLSGTLIDKLDMALFSAGTYKITKDGVTTTHTLTANDTVGTFIDELSLYGFDAVINDSGQVIVRNTGDSYINEGTSNVLTLLGMGDFLQTYSYTGDALVNDTVAADRTTALSALKDSSGNSLGITTGEFTMYNNGVQYKAVVSSDETLGLLMDKLESFGFETGLISEDGVAKIRLVGTGDAYIESAGSGSNVATLFTTGDSAQTLSSKAVAEVKEGKTVNLKATENTYLQDLIKNDEDDITDEITAGQCNDTISITNNSTGKTVSFDIHGTDTVGTLLDNIRKVGYEAVLSPDGKISVYSSDGAELTINSNKSLYRSLLNNHTDISSTMATSGEVQSSISEQANLSVSNWASVGESAEESTKLSLLNITKGTLSVYKDGRKGLVQIGGENLDEEWTLYDLQQALKTKLGDDFSMSRDSDGYLVISSKSGDIMVGSTTDTSNFASITGMASTSNGNSRSAHELYCVNNNSKVTDAGLFRRGVVTEGIFTVGNAIINVTSDSTIQDIASQINSNEKANATAYWDNVTGKFIIESRVAGASFVNIEKGTQDTDYIANNPGYVASNITDILGLTLNDGYALNTAAQTVGKNAKFTINGTEYTSTSNTIGSDVSRIQGVTLNLNKVSEGETVTITIERDTETLANAVEEVVNSYNELMTNVDEAISADGQLHKESTLKMIRDQLRNLMTSTLGSTNSTFKNLVEIGISTAAASGSNISTTNSAVVNLSFDRDKFINALKKDQYGVRALLVGTNSDGGGVFDRVETLVESALKGVTGYFDASDKTYSNQISKLNTKITKANEQVERYKEQLEAKFKAMDMMIAQMQQQYSSFLTT